MASKTWHEKLHVSGDLPKVETLPERMEKQFGKGTMALPHPLEIDLMIRKVPEGKLVTMDTLRKAAAAKHGATTACPFLVGIGFMLTARAALETGGSTPWWRVLKNDGSLAAKFDSGADLQMSLLEQEGFAAKHGGKVPKVVDFKSALVGLD